MKSLILALVLVTTSSYAFPVKDGEVTTPHTIVVLNDSQLEEIEALDTVTLTSDQWRSARKTMPHVQKRIVGILPANWESCTCCNPYQAILFPDDRLAIVHGLTIDLKGVGDGSILIRMGRHDRFYIMGRAYGFDALIALIRNSPNVSALRNSKGGRLSKSVSPPPGKRSTDPEIFQKVKRVYEELARKGWNRGGLPEYIEKS